MRIDKITSENDLYRLSLSEKTVVAIGFFDGVHKAHRELLKKAREYSKSHSLSFAVFSFLADSMLTKDPGRLYTDEEKCELLSECGADTAVLFDFGLIKDFSKEEFVNEILSKRLNAEAVFCGDDFKFAKKASANADDLKALMNAVGKEAFAINEVTNSGKRISTTGIKALLVEGKMREAAELLSMPYFITGYVTHGKGMGRAMGIPTVNIELPEGAVILPRGVYSTVVAIGDKRFLGLTNIGTCPTFGERKEHTETLILDFSDDVYDEKIKIYFLDYLREEKVFSGAEELVMQINIDKNKALELLGDLKWQEIGQSLQ
jgi:riboflavin kinase/FMN adenylyltransferase